MRLVQNIRPGRKRLVLIILSGILLFTASIVAIAQEHPPRPITVTWTAQNLSFGAFYQGATGGSVTISSGGLRTATGDVVLLNLGFSFSTSVYQVVGTPGTVVSLLNGPNVSLPGSNGGSMLLQIGASNPLSPFVITTVPPAWTLLNVGGILTVGTPLANPPGNYSGTFDITFVQE